MLNITDHQINANQNQNELSLHICQDGHYSKKKQKIASICEDVEKLEHICTVDGNVSNVTTMGKGTEALQKIKNGTTI